jgi:tetratricopeptide (TPR) repeat protein
MRTKKTPLPGGRRFLLGALAVLAVLGGAVRADDKEKDKGKDAELKKQVLALNDLTGEKPMLAKMKALAAEPKKTKELLRVALELTKEKPQPLNINATYVLAAVAQELKEVDTSDTFYLLNIKQALKVLSGRSLARAYVGRIQLLYDAGRYADSEKACREFLGIEGDESIDSLKGPVLRQLILNLYQQKQKDKALGLLDRVIKAQPDNFLNRELKARLLRVEGKSKEAIEIYEELLNDVGKDERLTKVDREELTDDYRYSLSGLYVDLGQIDKAAEQLKALLDRHPDHPTYNNDLGYIWADHDKNLEESERLIRKAIEEDRKRKLTDNPALKPEEVKVTAAYLDSLGWVLYKQKKYKESLSHLLEAVKDPEGKHIEIYDHLGDVYKALGQKDKAIAAYKDGLAAAGDTKREKERKAIVEKKLEELKK